MTNFVRNSACVCATLAAAACGAKTNDSFVRAAPGDWSSAHWTAIRRVEGGSVGRRAPAEFDIWMKGDSALIGATINGDQIRILRVGKDAYSWVTGRPNGMKFTAPTLDERQLAVASADFAIRAAACKANGKKGTTGTYDGHPFVRYDCPVDADGVVRIYYFATDLQNFPVHATIMYPDKTVIIYDAKNIEVPGEVADSLFTLPIDVQFAPGPAM
jgi:hypothetical protein